MNTTGRWTEQGGRVVLEDPWLDELEISRRWHQHHIFPQAFRERFRRLGIDVDDYAILIPPMHHLRIVHGGGNWYNRWWAAWLQQPGRTADSARRAARRLLRTDPRLKALRLADRPVQRYTRG